MSGRILLADDEPDILAPVRYALERAGYTAEVAHDGVRALELARQGRFDVVVLDVMMPRLNGLDACRELRAESDVPILMLTARDAEVDRVLGLELGADDYVTKPFSTAELLSRIRAILRRRQLDRAAGGSIREAAGIRIDLDRHTVSVAGEEVDLTRSEFRVLLLLMESPGRVFTRGQIMEHLWQTPYVGDARACDAHIANLRRKVERLSTRPERILTVRGIGYKLATG
jgi:two-component system response regulator RegX3